MSLLYPDQAVENTIYLWMIDTSWRSWHATIIQTLLRDWKNIYYILIEYVLYFFAHVMAIDEIWPVLKKITI